ncbi:Uncharacterised protein [Legionella steigerwaltii]|uniref:Opacity protein and related surface antigens n=1 Tax=Legionella steigerwaltii TaxID=460 RepID=A0A378L9T2_9GAMM|nr:hypothetical protein [Legionella steigerwaltii]KTD77463.1 hypothetical protein Lstg_1820 [Legionella steigerwaltii]STY22682.1 Uncharacterised protein [Legionella steigerwaltii]
MKKIVSLALCLFSAYAAAANISTPRNFQYLADLSLGPSWISGVKENPQIFNRNTDYEMEYLYNKSSNSPILDAELFLGIQKAVASNIRGQLGLNLSETSIISLKGTIWEFSDPAFNNFSYKYRLSHTDVAAKGKLIFDSKLLVNPYVSASIGVNFNQTQGLIVYPLTDEETYNPPVVNHNSSSFMYSVGVGLQKTITAHSQFGIGYQFKRLGQSNLIVDGDQLNSSDLYLNFLQFEVTYLI